ncbi:hypothetical protein LJR164_003458 [Phenylobacterium sp. LjRoot164]|uniref:hypothetical protein n=1 Tax=unclassified Phenylobacterium TaxID=2640670 RepID=UPI003ECDE9F2
MKRRPEDAPWSVAWSGEQGFRLQPSRDFPGRIELDQRQAPGIGDPIFAMMHLTRQRRAMADFLCHVCGGRTSGPDRYIFATASGGFVALREGGELYACNVPPMHRACADRARDLCPHLARLDDAPLRCDADDGRLIERTDVTPGLEAIVERLPRNTEVVFSCYRLYGPTFTLKVRETRAAWEAAARRRRP